MKVRSDWTILGAGWVPDLFKNRLDLTRTYLRSIRPNLFAAPYNNLGSRWYNLMSTDSNERILGIAERHTLGTFWELFFPITEGVPALGAGLILLGPVRARQIPYGPSVVVQIQTFNLWLSLNLRYSPLSFDKKFIFYMTFIFWCHNHHHQNMRDITPKKENPILYSP